MSRAAPSPRPAPRRRAVPPTGPLAQLLDFDRARIVRALADRVRYKYVQPLVLPVAEADGGGWKIVSPNCSRNIDPEGGEIDIAWFRPAAEGRWDLHARDHARSRWTLRARGLVLTDALALVCEDRGRDYWQ